MRIKYARKLSSFPFFPAETLSNARMLTAAVFELVQQFYHATEIGNIANGVSACADQPYRTK